MPTVEKLLVFLASPGDVADERRAVHEVVAELNRSVAAARGVVLQVVSWEHDTFPGYGSDAQAIVNQQIATMADYAVFIGVMWGRLGSPTPRAASGTVEEFERAADAQAQHGRPAIWFYFRDAGGSQDPPPPDDVRAFRKRVEAHGLPRSYSSPSAFRELVRQHLTLWLNQLPQSPAAAASQQSALLVALLESRADTIAADWADVVAELKRLRQEEAVERLTTLRQRFLDLHARHVAAVEAANQPLAHDLVGEVHEVLFQASEVVSAAFASIARQWHGSLRRRYIDAPTPDQDPEYAAIQRDLLALDAATNARMKAMRYPGDPSDADDLRRLLEHRRDEDAFGAKPPHEV